MPSPPPGRSDGPAFVLGHRMLLHTFERDRVISPALAQAGAFEAFQAELALALVRPGDVVLDLGAHVGYLTLLLARKVGLRGRVFAFEPDPDNLDLLRRNLALNGYQNVTVCPLAVADRCGPARLYQSADNAGDHRLLDDGGGRPSVEVQATTLDALFEGYEGPVHLVKMDVQGAEGHALEGMQGLLARCRPAALLTEFWPAGLERSGYGAAAFLRRLRGLGFVVYDIDEAGQAVRRATDRQLLQAYPASSDGFTNLLCVPADLAPWLG